MRNPYQHFGVGFLLPSFSLATPPQNKELVGYKSVSIAFLGWCTKTNRPMEQKREFIQIKTHMATWYLPKWYFSGMRKRINLSINGAKLFGQSLEKEE